MIKADLCRYLAGQKEPPFKHEVIGEVELPDSFDQNEPKDSGERRYKILVQKCTELDHTLKFYTFDSERNRYQIFVYGPLESERLWARHPLMPDVDC